MSVITLEGIVEHGQIRLKDNITLPESTQVYVIIPGVKIEKTARVFSPRLAHSEQAKEFQMEVVKESPDVGL